MNSVTYRGLGVMACEAGKHAISNLLFVMYAPDYLLEISRRFRSYLFSPLTI